MKNWIKARLDERTSWDGAALVAVGVIVLIAGPFAPVVLGGMMIAANSGK